MKIDFYIAGFQKAGTTNLAYVLSKCSNIVTHPQMECTFFYDEKEYAKGYRFLEKNYFFDVPAHINGTHYRLIKHSNSFTKVESFERAVKHSPDVKFILIFRNPVQRFVSSYLMERTRSLYPNDLKKAIEIALSDKNSFEHQVFYSFGKYDEWLKKILGKINENQIHYFLFEDLYNDIEHHLEQFSKKYNLNLDTSVLSNLPVQNTQKEFKSTRYQKLIVKLRHSKIKENIKALIPVKYWVKLTKKLEHINLVEPQEKFIIDKDLENILAESYYSSIKNFEAITGLKTNWLNGQ